MRALSSNRGCAEVKVCVYPLAKGEDKGDGGVGRVVRGQMEWLPRLGWEVVEDPKHADVINTHITMPMEWLRDYPDKSVVHSCHGLYWSEYEWEKWTEQANADVMEAIRAADHVTVPSEWVARIIERHTCRKPVVVPHGLNLNEWSAGENKGYVLWNKTRPDAVCDPAPVNAAAARMPNVPFVTTFGRQADNVVVTGKRTHAEAKQLVREAGVYLATSRETFGIGTLEALACGVPVVGYRWGGQAEFIEHGVDGWLARPGDVEGLVEGIQWALQHRAEIEPMARKKATQFPWERAARMYADLYQEALERKERERANPRTSIVVTAYKLEKYLDECLTSVARQSDQDWECVVVDDASPDRCGAIADTWAGRDPRFRVIHNETNQYLAEARNIGIREARGRFILPLDADDMLAPRAVEILAKALDARVFKAEDKSWKALHVAYGRVYFVKEDGTPEHYLPNDPGHSGWPLPFKWEHQLHADGRNLLPYASMFRKEAWRLTGGYRRRCRTAEDADFWCRLSSYGFRPRLVTDADTLIYRNRDGSMSRSEGRSRWPSWFPWAGSPLRGPAGAVVDGLQLPIPSLAPPALSVVIPVGPGHERIVADAVDSVDAQTLREWECIVVNDSGRDMIELPSWVRVLDTGGGKGVAHARNLGIAAATAKYYLPLDADDLLQPRALEVLWSVAQSRPGQILYSDFWEDPQQAGLFSRYASGDWRPEDLLRKGALSTVTALTPVEIWRDVGGYDEDLSAWEDWAFQLAAAAKGYCSARVAAPLFTYRKHTGRRAAANFADFEASKEGILRRFGEYYRGGKELMACSACSKKRTGTVYPPPPSMAASTQGGEGMALVSYDGERVASFQIRGPSRQQYSFRKGETRYVLDEDLDYFLRQPGFARAERMTVAEDAQPALASANPDAKGATDEAADVYAQLPGNVRARLGPAGLANVNAVAAASDEDLLAIDGIGAGTLKKIRELIPSAKPA